MKPSEEAQDQITFNYGIKEILIYHSADELAGGGCILRKEGRGRLVLTGGQSVGRPVMPSLELTGTLNKLAPLSSSPKGAYLISRRTH